MRTKLFFLLLIPTLLSADCDRCCDRIAHLSLGVGIFDVLKKPERRKLQFQADYKFGVDWYGVQPITSLMFTEQGTVYFCAGACYDIFIGNYLVLTPSFCPGVYFKGKGKDLGFPLEFRSALALAGEFRNRHRIGLQLYHISNASLGHKNPGAESLVFFYSIAIP